MKYLIALALLSSCEFPILGNQSPDYKPGDCISLGDNEFGTNKMVSKILKVGERNYLMYNYYLARKQESPIYRVDRIYSKSVCPKE